MRKNNNYKKQNSNRPKGRYYKNGYPAHSQCSYQNYVPKTGSDKGSEKWFIYGWKITKGGLVTVKIYESKNGKVGTSKSGKTWIPCVAVIENKDTGAKGLHNALFCEETKKAIITDLGWVCNPYASNGGFIGKIPNYKNKSN